ncbi:superinfection immunity protein [Klebsiella pneumoniae]|nr:superinfection immunity protein [Klebsiella pneumoniae]
MEVLSYLFVATLFFAINPVVGILFYFFPSLIAVILRKRNALIIILFNIVMGWFLPTWIIIFLWSILGEKSVPGLEATDRKGPNPKKIVIILIITILACGLIYYALALLDMLSSG